MNFRYIVPTPIDKVTLKDGYHVRINQEYTATVRNLKDFVEAIQEHKVDKFFGIITKYSDEANYQFRDIMNDIISKCVDQIS